jgi:hypothetical protein
VYYQEHLLLFVSQSPETQAAATPIVSILDVEAGALNASRPLVCAGRLKQECFKGSFRTFSSKSSKSDSISGLEV